MCSSQAQPEASFWPNGVLVMATVKKPLGSLSCRSVLILSRAGSMRKLELTVVFIRHGLDGQRTVVAARKWSISGAIFFKQRTFMFFGPNLLGGLSRMRWYRF